MKKIFFLFLSIIVFISCKNTPKNESNNTSEKQVKAKITPISHATAVMQFEDNVIYIDPTGGKKAFSKFEAPDYIMITDVHGDHMNIKTLESLDIANATLIAPEAVMERLASLTFKEKVTINNFETKTFTNFKVEAIPMYNLREEALKFHTKGRGNGYVITIGGERIYFSGDTEDIPEMRNLKDIDKAFVCMNLPYTMTVESAASAVLDFKPKMVYPYHYRGTNGKSDVAKFKQIVNQGNQAIKVVQLNWYP